MSALGAFDWAAEAIERTTSLSRIEARGALRLVLQKADLDPKSLTYPQLADLLGGALADDLEGRGIKNARALCLKLAGEIGSPARSVPSPAASDAEPPSVFDWVADAIDARSHMGRLQARGTVRLSLKEAGLSAEDLTKEQATVVLTHLMPGELRARAVAAADEICLAVAAQLASAVVRGPSVRYESPEEVFRRLGSRGPSVSLA